MPRETPLRLISVRLPEDILDRLPPPSLEGRRAQFIREAVEEKIKREDRKLKREGKV